MSLRVSTPDLEGVYQGSKWLKVQALIDKEEMASLLDALGDFWIFPIGGMVDGLPISKKSFIEEYGRWIEDLQKGKVPSSEDLRKITASVFAEDLDSLWLQPLPSGKFLTKISKPVIQVQAHYFTYSSIDGVFRPMSMGTESIFWGLQFSYPQIYQDAKTMEIKEVEEGALFRKLQLWVRNFTRPTPFMVDGKKINSPIRLGKRCFSWIHLHPELKKASLGVNISSL